MSEQPARVRSDAIDVLKGFGIFFVVLNHSFSRGSRKFLGAPVTEDATLYGINRAIHFAVPIFLFVSCALLTRSLVRSGNLGQYFQSRWRKTIVPYLIASVFYSWVFIGLPWMLEDGWTSFVRQVLTGKASFHLYFTVVLIQVSVAVPILVRLLKGRTLDWRLALAIGVVLQVAMYELQRRVFHWDRPGSIILWYLVPLLLGVAVGTIQDSASAIRPYAKRLAALTLLAGALYVFASTVHFRGVPGKSDIINGTYVLYTGFLALLLWTVVPDHPKGTVRQFLLALGRVSLPLFLVHPAVMYLIGGRRFTAAFSAMPGDIFWYWLTTLGLSYLAARLILATSVGRAVLGGAPRPAAPKPEPAPSKAYLN